MSRPTQKAVQTECERGIVQHADLVADCAQRLRQRHALVAAEDGRGGGPA